MMTKKQLKARNRRKAYLRTKHTNENLPKRILRGYPNLASAKTCSMISKAGYTVMQRHIPLRIKASIKR